MDGAAPVGVGMELYALAGDDGSVERLRRLAIRRADQLHVELVLTWLDADDSGTALVAFGGPLTKVGHVADSPNITMRLPVQHIAEPAYGPGLVTIPDHTAEGAVVLGASYDEWWEVAAGDVPVASVAAGVTELVFFGPGEGVPLPIPPAGLLAALEDMDSDGEHGRVEVPARAVFLPYGGGSWSLRPTPLTLAGRSDLWQARLRHTGSVGEALTLNLRAATAAAPELPTVPTQAELASLTGRLFQAEHLALSPLGATARMHGPIGVADGAQPPPTDVQEWWHETSFGRDEHAKVVLRGYLSSGHRAALVTVAQREFAARFYLSGPLVSDSGPTEEASFLTRYTCLVVSNPEVAYDPAGYPHHGREMLFRAVRLLTERTGPLAGLNPDAPGWLVGDGGALVRFDMVGTDAEGNQVAFSAPLMWIPEQAAGDWAAVSGEFAAGPDERREAALGGQTVALTNNAVPRGATRLPVHSVTFDLLPRPGWPPWTPHTPQLRVFHEALQHFAGVPNAVAVRLHPAYLDGSGGAAQPYLQLVIAQTLAFAAAQVGGLAKPDMRVDAVSVAAGAVADAFHQPGPLNPAALFGDARLFGVVPLAALLDPVQPLPPQVQTARDGDMVRIRYDWTPRLRPPADAATVIRTSAASVLHLNAELTSRVADPQRRASEVHGTLREFALLVADVVAVDFRSLEFHAPNAGTPTVRADVAGVHFLGELAFVAELASKLPIAGFADRPAIDVSPRGISAGYTLPIPPLTVGVFSLTGLTVSAGVEIPFDGRPARVRFALAERHHPFTVTVLVFAGGGFFALTAGADQALVEAAFEFGGNFELSLVVAKGGVHAVAGVYFAMVGTHVKLSGYLRCGGYLDILGIVGLSVEFLIELTYDDTGGRARAYGSAEVTVGVHVLLFNKTVTFSVQREFAGSDAPADDPALRAGDARFLADARPMAGAAVPMAEDAWDDYCRAFA